MLRSKKAVIVGTLMVVGSLLFLFHEAIWPLWSAHHGQWVATPCRIISSSVRQDVSERSSWTAEVTYEYEFGGRTYRSDRLTIAPAREGLRRSKAEAEARRYREGAQATCHVNAEDPSEAVLELGVSGGMLLGSAFMTAFFGGVGLLIVIAALKDEIRWG